MLDRVDNPEGSHPDCPSARLGVSRTAPQGLYFNYQEHQMVKIIMTVEQAKAAMDLYRAAKAIYGRPTPPSLWGARAHLLKGLKEAIEAFEKVNGGVFG